MTYVEERDVDGQERYVRKAGLYPERGAGPVAWGKAYLVATEILPDGRPMLAAALRALPAGMVLLAAFPRLPKGH